MLPYNQMKNTFVPKATLTSGLVENIPLLFISLMSEITSLDMDEHGSYTQAVFREVAFSFPKELLAFPSCF